MPILPLYQMTPLIPDVFRPVGAHYYPDIGLDWEHKVLFVQFTTNKYVIKRERSGQGIGNISANLPFASALYGSIAGRDTETRALDDRELDWHNSTDPNWFNLNVGGARSHAGSNAVAQEVKQYVQFAKNKSGIWVVMHFVTQMEDLKQLEGNLNRSTQVWHWLNRSSHSVYGLGKIAALDIFVNNYDRFDSEGKINNRGNIMFTPVESDPTYPKFGWLGMDFFDIDTGVLTFDREMDQLILPSAADASERFNPETQYHGGTLNDPVKKGPLLPTP